MDFERMYRDRLITVEEALSKVTTGCHIVSALGAAESKAFLSRLHETADRVRDVVISTCLPMEKYEYYTNPRYAGTFLMEGWFYNPEMRKAHPHGLVSPVPNNLHFAGNKRLFHRKPNIYIGSAAPMDKHGNISIGFSATYEVEMIKAADIVILEVNKNVSRTFGDTVIPLSDVDFIIESDRPVVEISIAEPSEKDMTIGGYIAGLVEDGSTIQLGIGGIPNAVAKALSNKKDLGVHTEMLTEGMIDLFHSGVINNSKKTIRPGKFVTTFVLGTRRIYDFVDDNPAVEVLRGSYTNDPYTLGQNYKMVSINTSIEIDLTGQCCSESIGTKQISGTGGQADTAVGAQNSPGGKSIIALYSTTDIKNPDGTRQTVSKIVPTLTRGAVVSLSRNDVDYVVTEYGVASLRGTSVRQRVERLLAITHPDFRSDVRAEAKELMIW